MIITILDNKKKPLSIGGNRYNLYDLDKGRVSKVRCQNRWLRYTDQSVPENARGNFWQSTYLFQGRHTILKSITDSIWAKKDKQTLLDTYKDIGRPLIDYARTRYGHQHKWYADDKATNSSESSTTNRDRLSFNDSRQPPTLRVQDSDYARPFLFTYSPTLDKVRRQPPSKLCQYEIGQYGQSKAG